MSRLVRPLVTPSIGLSSYSGLCSTNQTGTLASHQCGTAMQSTCQRQTLKVVSDASDQMADPREDDQASAWCPPAARGGSTMANLRGSGRARISTHRARGIFLGRDGALRSIQLRSADATLVRWFTSASAAGPRLTMRRGTVVRSS